MHLYIVRHGIAANVGDHGVRLDRDRMLTGMGRERTREVATGLKALGCAPEHIVSSPYVRARETAEIMRDVLGSCPRVDLLDDLAPGCNLEAVMGWLRRATCASVMVVGHLPDVADLTSLLTCEHGRVDYRFKKASVACIACDGKPWVGVGTLEWLLPPKVLRRAAPAT